MLASLPFTTSHAEWLGLVIAAISLIGIGGIVSTLICHQSGCYRRGRFRHGHYRLCHVHHPLVPSDGKITAQHIAAVKTGAETGEASSGGTAVGAGGAGGHNPGQPKPPAGGQSGAS